MRRKINLFPIRYDFSSKVLTYRSGPFVKVRSRVLVDNKKPTIGQTFMAFFLDELMYPGCMTGTEYAQLIKIEQFEKTQMYSA